MEIKIYQWLQEDIKSVVKDLLLKRWLIENNIPENKHKEYYMLGPDGGYGYDPPSNPEYGSFTWDVVNSKDYYKKVDRVEISIRDAMKLYLSDEE